MSTDAALPFTPQAVIFDMDGLMLDSERATIHCMAQAADEQGLQIESGFWLRMVGTGDVRAALAAGMTPIQIPDLLEPDAKVRALGHRIMVSLIDAQRLLEARLGA